MSEQEERAALAEIRGYLNILWKGFRKLNQHHKEQHAGVIPHDGDVWEAANAFANIQEIYQDLGMDEPK